MAAKPEYIAEARFKIITKSNETKDVAIRIAKPAMAVVGGEECWGCWISVEPGFDKPRNPVTGFTSLDALLQAVSACRKLVTTELKAKSIIWPELIGPGDDGKVSIKDFFRL